MTRWWVLNGQTQSWANSKDEKIPSHIYNSTSLLLVSVILRHSQPLHIRELLEKKHGNSWTKYAQASEQSWAAEKITIYYITFVDAACFAALLPHQLD